MSRDFLSEKVTALKPSGIRKFFDIVRHSVAYQG